MQPGAVEGRIGLARGDKLADLVVGERVGRVVLLVSAAVDGLQHVEMAAISRFDLGGRGSPCGGWGPLQPAGGDGVEPAVILRPRHGFALGLGLLRLLIGCRDERGDEGQTGRNGCREELLQGQSGGTGKESICRLPVRGSGANDGMDRGEVERPQPGKERGESVMQALHLHRCPQRGPEDQNTMPMALIHDDLCGQRIHVQTAIFSLRNTSGRTTPAPTRRRAWKRAIPFVRCVRRSGSTSSSTRS